VADPRHAEDRMAMDYPVPILRAPERHAPVPTWDPDTAPRVPEH
jgi:hypothetical protein